MGEHAASLLQGCPGVLCKAHPAHKSATSLITLARAGPAHQGGAGGGSGAGTATERGVHRRDGNRQGAQRQPHRGLRLIGHVRRRRCAARALKVDILLSNIFKGTAQRACHFCVEAEIHRGGILIGSGAFHPEGRGKQSRDQLLLVQNGVDRRARRYMLAVNDRLALLWYGFAGG